MTYEGISDTSVGRDTGVLYFSWKRRTEIRLCATWCIWKVYKADKMRIMKVRQVLIYGKEETNASDY